MNGGFEAWLHHCLTELFTHLAFGFDVLFLQNATLVEMLNIAAQDVAASQGISNNWEEDWAAGEDVDGGDGHVVVSGAGAGAGISAGTASDKDDDDKDEPPRPKARVLIAQDGSYLKI